MASMERRRRRLLLIILSLSLFATSMSAPTEKQRRRQTRSKSLLPDDEDSVGEVGDPQQMAWHAWINIDKESSYYGGELDVDSHPRKITPKSIFVAPPFPESSPCPDGLEYDEHHHCVQNTKFHPNRFIPFWIQQLNAANPRPAMTPQAAQSDNTQTGPLHLDLLNIPAEDSEEEDDADTATGDDDKSEEEVNTKKEIVSSAAAGLPDSDDAEDEDEEPEKQFFDRPQPTKDGGENDESNSNTFEGVIPVVDFVDDNNSSYSEVIDYKLETDDKLDNLTISVEVQESKLEADDRQQNQTTNRPMNESSSTPSLPLSTSTLLSSTNDDLIIEQKNTTEELSVKKYEENEAEPEGIVSATDSTPIQIFLNSSTTDDNVPCTSQSQSSTTEILEDTETNEPEDSETELPGEDEDLDGIEDSTESDDELLTHSEAGPMVTIPPHILDASTPADEETTSQISSETSITDDFIRETILLGLNLKYSNSSENSSQTEEKISTVLAEEKMVTVTPEMVPDQETTTFIEDMSSPTENPQEETTVEDQDEKESTTSTEVITKSQDFPETTRIYEVLSTDQRELNPVIKIEEIAVDESIKESMKNKESTSTNSPLTTSENPEEFASSEIMTASSSNNAEAVLSQNSFERIRFAEGPNSGQRTDALPVVPDTADKYVTSAVSEKPEIVTEKKTIDDGINLPQPAKAENFFPPQRKTPQTPTKDIVRFPEYDTKQNNLGYVRFPPNDANSIHTPSDIKDRLHHRPHSLPAHRSPIKSYSSPRKQAYWPNWRSNRQGSVRSKSTANEKPKDLSHWFWEKVPFFKEASSHPTNPPDTNERPRERSHNTSRNNNSKMSSNDDVPRAFARSAAIAD